MSKGNRNRSKRNDEYAARARLHRQSAPEWIKNISVTPDEILGSSGTRIHEQLEKLQKEQAKQNTLEITLHTDTGETVGQGVVERNEFIVSAGGARGLMQQIPSTFKARVAGSGGGKGGQAGNFKTQPYTGRYGPLTATASSPEKTVESSPKFLIPVSPVGYSDTTKGGLAMNRIHPQLKKQADWVADMISQPLIQLGLHNRWRSVQEAWEIIKVREDLYNPLFDRATCVLGPLGNDLTVAFPDDYFVTRIIETANGQRDGLYVLLDSEVDNSYGKVPVYRPIFDTQGERKDYVQWKRMQESILMTLIHTEAYFDFPLLVEIDGSKVIQTMQYARLRAEVDVEEDVIRLVALVAANLSSGVIADEALFVLNIGEFPMTYHIPLEVVEQAFVSSLDEIVDLGAGVDIVCTECEKQYSMFNSMSFDRLVLALSNKCAECFDYRSPSDFGDAVPAPF